MHSMLGNFEDTVMYGSISFEEISKKNYID
jgi:hypothetical protein